MTISALGASDTLVLGRRLPRGYIGRGHETIGSDILAVQRATINPARVFSAESLARLEQVKSQGWYPIEWLLDLMDELHERLADVGLKRVGRELFRLSHAEKVRVTASAARDIVYGIDGMYRFANRGHEIGGWRVLEFGAGHAELEKTTPHHCVMEEGILSEALTCVGAPAIITQTACIRDGADACRFTIRSMITDDRWSGRAR